MYTTVTFLALLALSQARFAQEQIPLPAIAAVQGGSPGEAQTIAGAAISDLLAAANDCAKLTRADQIISELGTGADAVAAAIGMVTAEKNFNPFVQSIPSICSDPTLPVTEILRGITPLIDPAVVGSNVANALSASSAKSPLAAAGMSIADLLTANGFTNFTAQAAAGGAAASPVASVAASSAPVAVASSAVAAASSAVVATTVVAADVCPATVTVTMTMFTDPASSVAVATAASNSVAAFATAVSSAATATAVASTGGVQASTVAGADFGLCVPTMKFEGGLGGRPATEFTFQIIDPLAAVGQQEALNPNIITNRICDQLTNVCQANSAAKTLCLSSKAAILALGTRNKTTADTWNTMLGFAGAVTNPDGSPDSPPATAPVAAGRMRRFVS